MQGGTLRKQFNRSKRSNQRQVDQNKDKEIKTKTRRLKQRYEDQNRGKIKTKANRSNKSKEIRTEAEDQI